MLDSLFRQNRGAPVLEFLPGQNYWTQTVTNCEFTSNEDSAIAVVSDTNAGGKLTVSDSEFLNNFAQSGAAVLSTNYAVDIFSSLLRGNVNAGGGRPTLTRRLHPCFEQGLACGALFVSVQLCQLRCVCCWPHCL